MLVELGTLKVLPMSMTWFEQGYEKGLEQGQRRLLLDLLEQRFGSLSDLAHQRLQAWPKERLGDLTRALVGAQSLCDLGLED